MIFHTILGIVLSLMTAGEDHDIHLSRTNVEYNQNNRSIEITTHIFIDDLELALYQEGIDSLYICTRHEADDAEAWINSYLTDHLIVQAEQDTLSWNFLGKEISDDLFGVWCYMEIEDVHTLHHLEVSVDYFVDLYDDQKNILELKASDQYEFFLLDDKKFTGTIKLKQ